MEGVDREMVKRVVHDMSVNSAHFATESRKEAAVEAKILAMKKRAASIRPSALATIKAAVDDRVAREALPADVLHPREVLIVVRVNVRHEEHPG